MELAPCHLSDAKNFEMTGRFLENLCAPDQYSSTRFDCLYRMNSKG
jgi:hypothetical protein